MLMIMHMNTSLRCWISCTEYEIQLFSMLSIQYFGCWKKQNRHIWKPHFIVHVLKQKIKIYMYVKIISSYFLLLSLEAIKIEKNLSNSSTPLRLLPDCVNKKQNLMFAFGSEWVRQGEKNICHIIELCCSTYLNQQTSSFQPSQTSYIFSVRFLKFSYA